MSEEQGFKLPEPGPEHELLKPFEGTFASTIQMWMGRFPISRDKGTGATIRLPENTRD